MNVDYDPFEGWEVTGKPRTVLSRGATVFEDGKVVSEPGQGRFVKRSLFEPAVMMLRFGVTVLPDPPYQRLVELSVWPRSSASTPAGRTTRRSSGRSRTR